MGQKFIFCGDLKSFSPFSLLILSASIRFLYTCEASVETWFLLWSVAVCDTIGDCLRRTYIDDPGHHRHLFHLVKRSWRFKEDRWQFFLLLKKNTKGIRYNVNYMNLNLALMKM